MVAPLDGTSTGWTVGPIEPGARDEDLHALDAGRSASPAGLKSTPSPNVELAVGCAERHRVGRGDAAPRASGDQRRQGRDRRDRRHGGRPRRRLRSAGPRQPCHPDDPEPVRGTPRAARSAPATSRRRRSAGSPAPRRGRSPRPCRTPPGPPPDRGAASAFADGRVERARRPAAVVVRRSRSRAGSRGSRSGPDNRRPSPSRRSAADRASSRSKKPSPWTSTWIVTPSSRWISAANAAVRSRRRRAASIAGKPAPPGIAGVGEQRPRAGPDRGPGRKSASLRPGMPGRHHPGRRRRWRRSRRGRSAAASPRPGRTPGGPGRRRTAAATCRTRSTAATATSDRRSCGPSVVVVGEPGRVERRRRPRSRGRPPRRRRPGSARRCRGRAGRSSIGGRPAQ